MQSVDVTVSETYALTGVCKTINSTLDIQIFTVAALIFPIIMHSKQISDRPH